MAAGSAVEYLCQQSRTQIYAHQLAGKLYRVTDLDAVRHLVDLHAYFPVVDTDYLALKALIINEDVTNFILANGAIEINFDKVSVDSGYISCFYLHKTLLLQTVDALLYPVEKRLEFSLALGLLEAVQTLQQFQFDRISEQHIVVKHMQSNQ